MAGARTLAGRLVTALGEPLAAADASADLTVGPALTHLFPTADAIAAADPASMSLTKARASALIGLAEAVADGSVDLEPGADREETSARMLALPGIGNWTVNYVRMRALGDPDVFMPTDLGVRHGLHALGVAGDARSAESVSQQWRPWRSYALQHVWAAASVDKTNAHHQLARTREEKIA